MILSIQLEFDSGYDHGWEEIARWEDIPPGTPYNEAFFCTHCGRIWMRRIWIGQECSWWLTLRQCDQSPFSFYDFPIALQSSNPQLMETLVNEFLHDPSICGYTGYSHLDTSPRRDPDRPPGLG